jgi:GNAT superfamily N-acetyltransferase
LRGHITGQDYRTRRDNAAFRSNRRRSPWAGTDRAVKEHTLTKANMPVAIRPLSAADKAEWRRLWTGYLAFYETTLPDAQFESTFTRLLKGDPHDYACLLATRDGRPVGLTHYVFHAHAWREQPVCYLLDLFADPDQRGTGIGRALIEAVYDVARAKGAHNVYWNTATDNATARQLYDRIAVLTPFLKYQKVL